MILYIDGTDFNKVTFGVFDGKETVKKFYKIDPHKSHQVLAKLGEFLRKSKISNPKSKIRKIIVNKGPGSYTGVRMGVAHALALGFAWNVPVKAVAKDKFDREYIC